MPLCYKCKEPIFFLSDEPTKENPSPKSIPINIDPDNKNGTIAIREVPNPHSVWPPERDAKVRKQHIRRLYAEAARIYVAGGGALYRVHFDTCEFR